MANGRPNRGAGSTGPKTTENKSEKGTREKYSAGGKKC